MPLSSLKKYIHATEVLNSPLADNFKEAMGLPLGAGGFLEELSIWKMSVLRRLTIQHSILSLWFYQKIGQGKTGFRWSRKDYVVKRTFWKGYKRKYLEGKFKLVRGGTLSLAHCEIHFPPKFVTSSVNTHSKLHFTNMYVSFRSERVKN